MSTAAETAQVAATALHAGFQLVVTVLVYPAFAEVPVEEWTRHHTAHSRRITPLVVGVYAAVVAACGWVLVAGGWQPSTAVAVAASALAMLTTAAVAAPAHGRLGAGRAERDLTVLVRADRVRLAASLVAAAAAFGAAVR